MSQERSKIMRYKITGIVTVTADYTPGDHKSTHVCTDFRLEVSKHLDQSQYNDKKGLPTKGGSHALTQAFVQGLVGNIHHAHQKGFRDSAEHLRYIISELERGFAAVGYPAEGTMEE